MQNDKAPIDPPESPDAETMLRICQDCHARCCSYVAIEIDTPESITDFENIRWYCAHKDIWVFMEDDEWHVVFESRCEKLGEDSGCTIYDKRPDTCKHYKWGECEYYLRGSFDLELRSLEEVDAYVKKRFPKRWARKQKARRKETGAAGSHAPGEPDATAPLPTSRHGKRGG